VPFHTADWYSRSLACRVAADQEPELWWEALKFVAAAQDGSRQIPIVIAPPQGRTKTVRQATRRITRTSALQVRRPMDRLGLARNTASD
jgi:hypothetical protein